MRKRQQMIVLDSGLSDMMMRKDRVYPEHNTMVQNLARLTFAGYPEKCLHSRSTHEVIRYRASYALCL